MDDIQQISHPFHEHPLFQKEWKIQDILDMSNQEDESSRGNFLDSYDESEDDLSKLLDSVNETDVEKPVDYCHVVNFDGSPDDSLQWNFLDIADVTDQEKWKNLVSSKNESCHACWDFLQGSHVSCEMCRFRLHKWCAQQPPEIRHPFHPQHRLEMVSSSFKVEGLLCYACFFPFYGYCYFCLGCDIFLHLSCASSTVDDSRRSKKVSFAPFSYPQVSKLKNKKVFRV